MSGRFELQYAQLVGDKLIEILLPHCQWITLAGSVRRKSETVKDIELVAIPKPSLFDFLDKLVGQGITSKALYGEKQTTRWGRKYRGMVFNGITCELFLCDEDNCGWITYLRTGPGDLNRVLVTKMKYQSPYTVKGGYIWDDGKKISLQCEEDFFALLGIEYVPPEYREIAKYKTLFAKNNHQWGKPIAYAAESPGGNKVVNFKDVIQYWDPASQKFSRPEYEYIGRENLTYKIPASKWHNPYKIGPENSRMGVLEKYEQYILLNNGLKNELSTLKGKTLVCWCAPKSCHGDILGKLIAEEPQHIQTQQTLWGQSTFYGLEPAFPGNITKPSHAEPLFTWGWPWLDPDFMIWVHIGYGVWEKRSPSDPLVQHMQKLYTTNRHQRGVDAYRLRTWLDTKK